MMQLGFVSAILPELSTRDVFEQAAAFGYDCIELMCWPAGKAERRYAGVTHVDVDAVLAGEDPLTPLVDEYGVQVSAMSYYPNPLTPDHAEGDAAIQHLTRLISAAQALGIDNVNTFVGRDWRRSIDDNWPRFLELFEPLVEHAEECGVRLGIENCPMFFTEDEWPGGKNLAISPRIWRRMFEAIPSPNFGLNYDPSHMVFQQMDYLAPLIEFAPRLFHVHAKDVRVDQHRLNEVGILACPLEYHSPKLPGLGEVDWGRFFSVLTDVGYRGPVCVEVEDRAYEDSLDSRRLALQQSATYLRNFLPSQQSLA